MGCLVFRNASRLTTSITRAMPTPMTRDSPNGKSSISRPAMGKPMSGTKTNIHIQPIEDFLFFCAAVIISGELHLSEKPTSPAPPCGGAEDAAWLTSIGSGVLKFTALPQPMQNSAPSGNSAPQALHTPGEFVCVFTPQPEQKTAPSGSLFPQLGQN